jgi:hypothetical protein
MLTYKVLTCLAAQEALNSFSTWVAVPVFACISSAELAHDADPVKRMRSKRRVRRVHS